MESKHFLSPKLTGKRFDEHSVPVEVLEDFAAFQELITELAKSIYLQDNPKRKRVPKGFTEGVTLNLEKVEEGSAILKFFLATTLLTSSILGESHHAYTYFEKAKNKVIEVIDAAESTDADLAGIINKKYLSYFHRIGRNLKDDEEIFFKPSGESNGPAYNKTIRKNIIVSYTTDATYEDKFDITAEIDSISKSDRSFVVLVEGQKLSAKLDPKFYKTIISTFREYDSKAYVNIQGDGIYNKKDKLIRIEHIAKMDVLDPFDVSIRLMELGELKDGWYNSEGLALSKKGLINFESQFNLYYPDSLPLPAIFPTISGNIQLEWTVNEQEISLEIDLKTLSSELIMVDTITGQIVEEKLDLADSLSWESLSKFLS